MAIEQIITVAIIIGLVVFGISFVLRGLRRGWIKAVMDTGNIVLSAFLACFLSRDITTIARDYIYPLFIWITNQMGLSLEEQLAEFEAIVELLPMLIGVFITPILFLIIFCIFYVIIAFISMFFYRSKRKTVNEEGETVKVKRHVPLWSRLCGVAIGIVNAVLLLGVLLVPTNGYANLVNNVWDVYFETVDTSEFQRGTEEEPEEFEETLYFIGVDYVKPICENGFFKATYSTLGRPMFNHMTTTVYHEDEFNLENEFVTAIRLIRETTQFASSDFSKMDEERVEQLHGIVDTLDDSALMPELMATVISEMCNNWARGEELFGMDKPELGELLDPTFDVLLDILASTDRSTLIDDLNTLLELLDLLVDHEIFDNLDDSNKLMDILSKNPDLIKQLRAIFEANDHLAPMSEEIGRLCVRAVTQSLDMDNLELTGQLTDSINAFKDDPEQLSQELTGIVQNFLDEQSISATVSPEMTDEVAQAISKEFADKDNVTEDEVVDFVLNYATGQLADSEGNVDLDGDGIPDGNIDDVIPDGTFPGGTLPEDLIPGGTLPEDLIPQT